MKNNRDKCITETLKWEGGYTNDANDAGGPTNWGITIDDARRYWKADATSSDVKAMPKAVAINIYATKYWKTSYYDCDKLAPGIDLVVFDAGVNSGPSRAANWLKKSQTSDDKETINKFCDTRLAFLRVAKNRNTGEPLWPSFGKGWSRRVDGIRLKALQMVTGELKPEEGTDTPPVTSPEKKTGFAAFLSACSAALLDPNNWPWFLAGAIVLGLSVYFIHRWLKKGK